MTRVRIIKRTYPLGDVMYIIQKKHWLLGWMDADDPDNYVSARFRTLEEAKEHINLFNGTKPKDEVVDLSEKDDFSLNIKL